MIAASKIVRTVSLNSTLYAYLSVTGGLCGCRWRSLWGCRIVLYNFEIGTRGSISQFYIISILHNQTWYHIQFFEKYWWATNPAVVVRQGATDDPGDGLHTGVALACGPLGVTVRGGGTCLDNGEYRAKW